MAIIKQEEHRSSHHYNHHLHSVQQSSKITKKPLPLAASSTSQPKVYKVKPIHFRELVQQLTGAQPELIQQQQQQQQQQQPKSHPRPQARPRRSNLHVVAPPPSLPLHPHQLQLQLQSQTETTSNDSENKQVKCKVEEQEYKPFADNKMQNNNGVGTTELILSPNFQAWFSFAMLSPGSAALSQMQ